MAKYPGNQPLDMLLGQGKHPDTGKQSSGYGESMDAIVGAPARVLVDEFLKGQVPAKALAKVFAQIGSDPATAPTGWSIAEKYADQPQLQKILAMAIDFGAQMPGTQFVTPGVIGEIKGVKNVSKKVTDAVEAFAERGKQVSTETKIAQMHGKTGEVRDAVETLTERAKYDMEMAQRYGIPADEIHKLTQNKDYLKDFQKKFNLSIEEINRVAKSGKYASVPSAYDNPRNAPPKPDELIPNLSPEDKARMAAEDAKIAENWRKVEAQRAAPKSFEPANILGQENVLVGKDFPSRSHVMARHKERGAIPEAPRMEDGVYTNASIPEDRIHPVDKMLRGGSSVLPQGSAPIQQMPGDKRFVPVQGGKKGPRFWHDKNDHRFDDDAKQHLDNIVAHYGAEGESVAEALKEIHSGEFHHKPYVGHPSSRVPLPNYAAKPTGVIGEPRIQGLEKHDADPLSWMDDKYKAAKRLIMKHASTGTPLTINTSSDLIAKKDYMKLLPKDAQINIHMLGPNDSLNRILFPGNASQKRLERAARELEKHGFKVNRVYPKSGEDFLKQSEIAYKHDVEKRSGLLREELSKKIDEELALGYEDYDKFAHGGIVGYADGGKVSFQKMPSLPHAPGWGARGRGVNLPPTVGVIPAPAFIPDADFIPEGGKFIPDDEFISNEDAYGGFTGALKAAALGTARGATLGLSDVALTKSGLVDPQTIKGLQEENPISSFAGELGSLAIPGSGLNLIAKAGKATFQGAKALKAVKALEEASGGSKVVKAITDIAAFGAGSAVEGALYAGSTQSLNEYALGDPNLNAQKVLANIGHGAMWGGIFGGALKGASLGVPPSVDAFKKAMGKIKVGLIGEGTEGLAANIKDNPLIPRMLAEKHPKLAEAILKRNTEALDAEGRSKLVGDITGWMGDAVSNLQTALKELNEWIRPAERDELINTSGYPTFWKDIQDTRQGIIHKFNGAIDTILGDQYGVYMPSVAKHLQGIRDALVGGIAKDDTPAKVIQRLLDARSELGKIAYDKTTAAGTESRKLVDDIYQAIRGTVQDSNLFGPAGAAQAKHDEMLHQIYNYISPNPRKTTEFQKAFMKKVGQGDRQRWVFDPKKMRSFLKNSELPEFQRHAELLNSFFDLANTLPQHIDDTFANLPNKSWSLGKPFDVEKINKARKAYRDSLITEKGRKIGMKDQLTGAATYLGVGVHPLVGAAILGMDVASRPIEYVNKLAHIERALGKFDSLLTKGAKSVFQPTLKALGKAKAPITKANIDPQAHNEFSDNLSEMLNNPDLMEGALSASIQPLQDTAPDMAGNIQMGLIAGAQFLASKMRQGTVPNPFEPKYEPSQQELLQFEGYKRIIENPLHAFEEISDGTISGDTIETLGAVYPELYEDMKGKLLEEMATKAAKKEPIDYYTKLAVSKFLGQPVEPSFSPAAVQANQAVFLPPVAQPMPMGGTKKSKMTLAERSSVGNRPDRDV